MVTNNSQNKNVLWKIVTMVTNNKTRQQCSTRDRQKVCDKNLITEPTGQGLFRTKVGKVVMEPKWLRLRLKTERDAN